MNNIYLKKLVMQLQKLSIFSDNRRKPIVFKEIFVKTDFLQERQ